MATTCRLATSRKAFLIATDVDDVGLHGALDAVYVPTKCLISFCIRGPPSEGVRTENLPIHNLQPLCKLCDPPAIRSIRPVLSVIVAQRWLVLFEHTFILPVLWAL